MPRRSPVCFAVLLSARTLLEAAAATAAVRRAFPSCTGALSVTLDAAAWRDWVPAGGVDAGLGGAPSAAVLREVRGYLQAEISALLRASGGSGLVLVTSVEALPVGALPPLLAAMGEGGAFADGGRSLSTRRVSGPVAEQRAVPKAVPTRCCFPDFAQRLRRRRGLVVVLSTAALADSHEGMDEADFAHAAKTCVRPRCAQSHASVIAAV